MTNFLGLTPVLNQNKYKCQEKQNFSKKFNHNFGLLICIKCGVATAQVKVRIHLKDSQGVSHDILLFPRTLKQNISVNVHQKVLSFLLLLLLFLHPHHKSSEENGSMAPAARSDWRINGPNPQGPTWLPQSISSVQKDVMSYKNSKSDMLNICSLNEPMDS